MATVDIATLAEVQQAQQAADNALGGLSTHVARTDNPHTTTKSQVGLSKVDNVQQIAMADAIRVVKHGADATVPRPVGYAIVWWVGTVVPNNIATGDYYDNQA